MTHRVTDAPFLRPAVRGLVIDRDNHILMARLVYAHGAYWVLPGGGIEDGEDTHRALTRELHEEVGLHDVVIGPALWNRSHVFDINSFAPDGRPYEGQRETVFEIRVERFTPTPLLTVDELHAENLHEVKWWTLDEIERYDGSDFFAPPNIVELVRAYVSDGPPHEPLEIVQK